MQALHWSSLMGMLLSIFDPQFICIIRRESTWVRKTTDVEIRYGF